MASSSTEICNMAIAHLGIGKQIATLTERSQEANVCSIFYETAKDITLRDFDWPFTTKNVDLGLVETDPTTEWSFSYRYPSDAVKIRRILSGIRNDNNDTEVPHKIYADDSGKLLYCDIEDAVLEYTARIDVVEQYPLDFVMALSYRLASLIAPTIVGVKNISLVGNMLELYNLHVGMARQNSAGEEKQDRTPESEFIRAREDGAFFDNTFPRRTI